MSRPPLEQKFGQQVAIEVKTFREFKRYVPAARERLIQAAIRQALAIGRNPANHDYPTVHTILFTEEPPKPQLNGMIKGLFGYEITLALSEHLMRKHYAEEMAAADAIIAGK